MLFILLLIQGIFWLYQTHIYQPSKCDWLQTKRTGFGALSLLHFRRSENTGWTNCKDHQRPGLYSLDLFLSNTRWSLYTSLDQFKDPFLCMMSVTGRTNSKTGYSKKHPPPCIISVLVLGPCIMVITKASISATWQVSAKMKSGRSTPLPEHIIKKSSLSAFETNFKT